MCVYSYVSVYVREYVPMRGVWCLSSCPAEAGTSFFPHQKHPLPDRPPAEISPYPFWVVDHGL
jgi:hypothetical protein